MFLFESFWMLRTWPWNEYLYQYVYVTLLWHATLVFTTLNASHGTIYWSCTPWWITVRSWGRAVESCRAIVFFWNLCPPAEWLSTPRQWLLLFARAKFKLHILKRKSLQRILIHCYLAQTCDQLARVGKTSVLHNLLYIYIVQICAYFGRKSICRYDKGRFSCILPCILHQILICFT